MITYTPYSKNFVSVALSSKDKHSKDESHNDFGIIGLKIGKYEKLTFFSLKIQRSTFLIRSISLSVNTKKMKEQLRKKISGSQ